MVLAVLVQGPVSETGHEAVTAVAAGTYAKTPVAGESGMLTELLHGIETAVVATGTAVQALETREGEGELAAHGSRSPSPTPPGMEPPVEWGQAWPAMQWLVLRQHQAAEALLLLLLLLSPHPAAAAAA